MAFEIYARWKGQDAATQRAQAEAIFRPDSGAFGYLREAHVVDAMYILAPEAFANFRAKIPASRLRNRLPKALEAAARRQKELYQIKDPQQIKPILQSFRDFVDLCEMKEKETGEPVTIYFDK